MAEKKSLRIRRKTFYIWRVIIIAPFVIGVLGYLKEGFPLLKALYASFCFYFVSVYSTISNPLLEIARWTAPLVVFSGLIWSLRGLIYMFRNSYLSMNKKATVIYHDEEQSDNAELLSADIKKSFTELFVPSKPGKFYPDVPNQIVMFNDDFDNLAFISQHYDELKDKNVCVQISRIDSSHLDSSNFNYFNKTEVTGAMYWDEYPIAEALADGKRDLDIVIIGSDELGEKIIMAALLNNIFCSDQHIKYHIFGDQKELKFVYGDNTLANGDELIFHDDSWADHTELLTAAERIIYTDESYDPLECLLYAFPTTPIYYYSNFDEEISRFFHRKNIYNFGSSKKIYRERYILGDGMYSDARELNYIAITGGEKPDVADIEKFKDDEWKKLDGFTQGAFKSCVDFHRHFYTTGFLPEYTPEGIEELARIEHVRQCRLYFINGWHLGPEEMKERDDTEAHLSKMLKPFDELDKDTIDIKLQHADFLLKASRRLLEQQ